MPQARRYREGEFRIIWCDKSSCNPRKYACDLLFLYIVYNLLRAEKESLTFDTLSLCWNDNCLVKKIILSVGSRLILSELNLLLY